MSDFLAAEGIRAFEGYQPAHITSDLSLVVVGNAISRGNPELEEVLARKIRYCSLPEAIREHFLWGSRSIVIAGTHGKTTTTSLTGWLLTAAGVDPTVFVGGIARNFGQNGSSYRRGQGRDFVIEGDEYDSAFFDKTAKFLKYLPDIAVINNIELDHADIYADLDAVKLAFRRLVLPRATDRPVAARRRQRARASTGGRCDLSGGDVRLRRARGLGGLRPQGCRWPPDVFRPPPRHDYFGAFELPLIGAHNVRNALAGIAVAHCVGISATTVANGLKTFAGVKRRLEIVGRAGGVTVYDDFAHHPTAVAETLSAVRQAYPGRRVWAVFEPRSASSCRRVFQRDFARAFGESGADETLIATVFRSSLPEHERLSVEDLVKDVCAAGRRARHVGGVDAIVDTIINERRDGDVVVVMSNGAFDGLHRKLVSRLEAAGAAA